MSDAHERYVTGQSFGIVLGGISAALHARCSANAAVSSLTRNVALADPESVADMRRRDIPELAAQFRALADALDALSLPAAKLSEAA